MPALSLSGTFLRTSRALLFLVGALSLSLVIGISPSGAAEVSPEPTPSSAESLAEPLAEPLPRTLRDTLPAEESAPTLTSPEETLENGMSAALAGEDAALTDTLNAPPLMPPPFNRALSIQSPRDPLREPQRRKGRLGIQMRGRLEYDDNVSISAEDPEGDLVVILSPTVSVNAGDFRKQEASYLSAAYTATASSYLSDTTDDTLDHLAEVEGQWKRGKTAVPFTVEAIRESGAYIELGGRDTAETYGASLGLDHRLSSKLSLGGAAEFSATDYELFADYYQYLADAYLELHLSSKTSVATVYRYSHAKTEGADSQAYQAALIRGETRPSSKWNVFGEAGAAFSQLGKGDRTDLLYRLAVAYQPNARQRFSLQAVRQPNTSAFTAGTGMIRNGVELSMEQAIGRKLRLILNGGYQLRDYFAADEGTFTDREDDYFLFSALLAYEINPHWQAEVYYSYVNNDSTDSLLGFDNQRAGMGLTWTY